MTSVGVREREREAEAGRGGSSFAPAVGLSLGADVLSQESQDIFSSEVMLSILC